MAKYAPHEIPLALISNQLSHLHYALDTLFADRWCEIKIDYHGGLHALGLQVKINVKSKFSQEAADRLLHGALHGPYDFRFRAVGRELSNDPDAWVWVTAQIDTQHLPNGKPEKKDFNGFAVTSRVIQLHRQGYSDESIAKVLEREFA